MISLYELKMIQMITNCKGLGLRGLNMGLKEIRNCLSKAGLSDEQIEDLESGIYRYDEDAVVSYLILIAESVEDQDKDLARRIYSQAIEKARDSSDLINIAESVENKDEDLARRIYSQAIDKSENSSDLIKIAEHVINQYCLGDKKWARRIYSQAVDRAKDFSDLIDIAESLANKYYLEDYFLADELYMKVIDQAEKVSDLMKIAETIVQQESSFGEKFIGETLSRVINKSEEISDLYDIAKFLKKYYFSKKHNCFYESWAREFTEENFSQAIDQTEEISVLNDIAEFFKKYYFSKGHNCSYENWARELYDLAEDKVRKVSDLRDIAKFVRKYHNKSNDFSLVVGVGLYLEEYIKGEKIKINTFFQSYCVSVNGLREPVFVRFVDQYNYQKKENKLLNGKLISSMLFEEYLLEQLPEDLRKLAKTYFINEYPEDKQLELLKEALDVIASDESLQKEIAKLLGP